MTMPLSWRDYFLQRINRHEERKEVPE